MQERSLLLLSIFVTTASNDININPQHDYLETSCCLLVLSQVADAGVSFNSQRNQCQFSICLSDLPTFKQLLFKNGS